MNDIAAALNGISVGALITAAAWYLRKYGNPLDGAARLWIIIVAGISLVSTARGFASGVIPKFILLDLLAFASLLCFVVIGSIPRAFEELRRVWFWVLILSIPLNLMAMADLEAFSSELSSGVRVARETISYRTHNTLDVVLLLGAFSFTMPRWKRLVVVVGFSQVIAMQILYQKRLETAYYLCAALFCMWIWGIETGVWRDRLRQYLREAVIVFVLVIGFVVAVQGRSLIPQAIALFERSVGKSEDVEFTSGAARYFLVNNERFEIVLDSLGTLTTTELWFGRGMGGAAEWAGFNAKVLESNQSEDVWAALYLPDFGFFGRRSFEIGAATPILKGGIIFWLAIYAIYLLFGLRLRQITQTLTGRLCIVIVAFQIPYAFFGGDFNVSSIFQMGNYAACLGMGIAASSSYAQIVGPRRQHLDRRVEGNRVSSSKREGG